ncbi:MAG: glucose 1-dehydrogenase [Gemmatimonadota bacterium]|nr:glucose 1-dehydrogenase [Gemmatimonadota bacterium]
MSEFEGKVVIVTGGAKGIGGGISEAFDREGAHVICADVDKFAGAEISKRTGVLFQCADVSLSNVCKDLVDKALSNWGSVDILCNNVGIQPTASYLPAHELPEDAWDRIINVNLKSRFLMSKYCIPVMIKRGGGVIINTASVQGLQSALGVSAYAASKGGDLSLTRQLALEYAKDNIRVLAVNPGTIDTPLVEEALESIGGDEAALRLQMAEAHPVNRLGQPEDIANAVLFLASSKAGFMTGSYVNVDGGMMAKGAWA